MNARIRAFGDGGTILRATEGDIPMIECEDENGHCPLDKFCRLRNVLARAREAYAAVDSVTITELTAGASPVTDPSGARNGSSENAIPAFS